MNGTTQITPPGPEGPWWVYKSTPRDSALVITLRFVEATDPPELVLWGVEITQPHPREAAPEEISVRALAAFERAARKAIAALTGAEYRATGQFPSRVRRELTDEFLASAVRRHRELAEESKTPTKRLAQEEGVAVTTVKNWLQRARKAGIKGAS